MGKLGGYAVAWGVVGLIAVGCDQELVLAPQGRGSSAEGGAWPDDGVTGQGGAADEAHDDAALPVLDGPVYSTFGGAGGEAGSPSADTANAGQAAQPDAVPEARGGAAGEAGTSGEAGAAGSTTESEPALPGALLLTEYVEGSGSFKALELYALRSSVLDACELQTYFNGKPTPSRLALHGTLAPGQAQVLCSGALADKVPSRCDRSTNLTFNGDDALVLSCGGRVLDSIGQVGTDPGTAWGEGATADHTLRRRCSVSTGRIDPSLPFESLAEWDLLGPDNFDDLGSYFCD